MVHLLCQRVLILFPLSECRQTEELMKATRFSGQQLHGALTRSFCSWRSLVHGGDVMQHRGACLSMWTINYLLLLLLAKCS